MNRRINFTISNVRQCTDPEGRFMIMNLSVQNLDLCTASLYGPNVDDPSFFHTVFTSLSTDSDTKFTIGDFTLVFNLENDRLSAAVSQMNWRPTDSLKKYMLGIHITPLSGIAPSFHQYTTHILTWTHLLHFDGYYRHRFILSLSLITHQWLSLWLKRGEKKERTHTTNRNCGFNPSLVKAQDFISYFKEESATYLENNDLLGIPSGVLWKTGKVLI